jgi:tetratricopeptide (TPR) repeat protein
VDVLAYFYAWEQLEWFERDYQAALDRLAAAPEEVFTGRHAGLRPLLEGDQYRVLDQPERARASYEAALAALEGWAEETPQDHIIHMLLAQAYAGLGRNAEAIREAQHAVDLLPVSKDALEGVDPVWALAVVYTMVEEYEAAMDKLEYLLSIPSWTTVWTLRLDPRWDPLRDHPRFKKLVGEDWQAEASP